MRKTFTSKRINKTKRRVAAALCLCVAALTGPGTRAQQYDWVKNSGAAATLYSGVAISPTLNPNTSNGVAQNETWAVLSSGSSTRIFGAGNGTAPDLGSIEKSGALLARYDANMNMVWYANISTVRIVADPRVNDQFYIITTATAANSNYLGLPWTGQANASTSLLFKCKATGTTGISVLWCRKIDGLSDDAGFNLTVKDIGNGHTRIVVAGITRSTSISTYNDATNGIAHTVAVPGGGGTNYDSYIACYDEDVSAGTINSLWINDFGAVALSESTNAPVEIADNGDVYYSYFYISNSLGTINYTLSNSSGASPGTTTITNYPANITNNRYILFSFNGSTGSPNWVRNELANASTNFRPYGLNADAAGNIYVAGILNGAYTPASGISMATTAGDYDLGVVVFDNTGTPLRAQHYGNSGSQIFYGLTCTSTALDRANNRLYIAGQSGSTFAAGTATVQAITGNDGLLLAVDANTLNGISAVTCNGSVANATEAFGSVAVRPDGQVIATQHYPVSAANRLNGGTTHLLPKTAWGYQDVAITSFDGNAANLLMPLAEGGWGGTTANSIQASALANNQLISAGYFSGTMTVAGTTLSSVGNSGVLMVTDTATGVITKVSALLGVVTVYDMKINPADGSVYVCGTTGGDITPYGGSALGKSGIGGSDAFVTKLDANFNHLWTAYIGGAEGDFGRALEVDPANGDVYLGGYFLSPTLKLNPAGGKTYGSSVIATNSNTNTPITSDIFVAKFDRAGVMQWISSGGSASTAANDAFNGHGLKLMNGSLYVGGYAATNSTFNFGGQSLAFSSTGGNNTSDMVMMKLDPAAGNVSWIKGWMGNDNDNITSLATDNNLVYMSGNSLSANGMTLGSVPFVSAGSYDAFVFAVDGNGTEQPGLAQLKGNGYEYIYEIKPDGAGNLFFAGVSGSTSLPVGGATLGTSGNTDCLSGAIDEVSMTSKWAFLNGSVNGDNLNTVTPGKIGMAFVGGTLTGQATFGSNVVPGRLGGDFVYGRISYPYIAPGAQISTLNTWFKANALLTGAPATQWSNSTTNSVLNNMTNTGSVPVNATGLNFNPTLNITGGAGYLSQGNIFAPNAFDASGSNYSVYVVAKPSAAADVLNLWSESTTGTGITLGAAGNTVTGTGGGKTVTNIVAMPPGKFSVSTLLVNGSDATNYLNGTANGRTTGVSALSTTNAGTFAINGSGNMNVAEVVTYGGYHTPANFPVNRVETYLGVKYGITLGHHYYSTSGDTLYKIDNGYANNIAGIGVDSAELLIQKQSRSQNTTAKGDMLTIGMGTIATDNSINPAAATADGSYLVWGDDNGSVTSTQTSNMANTVSSCALRLPRVWRIQRTRHGIGSTQVQMDLSNTIDLSPYTADDIQLMIDQDGDGNFATGSTKLVSAGSLSDNVVTFNNVLWDTDGSGADLFAIVFNNKIPGPVLVAKGNTIPAPQVTCKDVAGSNVFVDKLTRPTGKYAAIDPNGNVGYNFDVTAMNNNPAVNNQMKTNGSNQTTALNNRMYIIHDNGANNYPTGMTVRVYYDPQDSIDAVAALDPSVVSGTLDYSWFKYPGNDVSNVLANQTSSTITGITLLTPSAYGEEGGVKYVEFTGIKEFSVFGAIAKRGITPLPMHFTNSHATPNSCSVNLSWNYAIDGAAMVKQFEVQRSSNGRDFEKIATVLFGSKTYTDMPPHDGDWNYRIKATENGSATYSSIMPVPVKCNNAEGHIRVFPVPAVDQITISMNGAPVNASYKLYNALGAEVRSGIVTTAVTKFSVANLPTATYILKIQNGKATETRKLNVLH